MDRSLRVEATPSRLAEDPVRILTAVGWALGVVAAAGLVVALGRFGETGQMVAVVAIAIGLPALVIFLARPVLGLGLYLVLLPLVYTGDLLLGLNGGELLTLGVLLLGLLTLARARRTLWDGVTTLAPLLVPMAVLALVSVASLLANDIRSIAEILSSFLKILAFGLVPLLVYMHAGTERTARRLLIALLVGGLLEALYSVGAFTLGLNYYEQYGYHRATGTFYTFNYLGAFMALVLVPTLAFALGERGKTRWLFLFAFVLEVVALLLSLTLGSLLGLLVAGVVAGVFLLKLPIRRLATGAVSFLVVLVMVLALNPTLQDKVTRIGERVVDRLTTYSVGLSMLGDRFWFGFGSQTQVIDALFASLEYRITPFGVAGAMAHASILTVGVEKGIFGVVAFVLVVAGTAWILVRDREALATSRFALLYQGLLVGALAFMVQDMTNNLLLHGRLGILFFSVVGLIAALGKLAGEPDPGRGSEPAGGP